MESETLPLEQLLTRYEEGVKLIEVCQTRLAAAELRIQQLEKTASGEARLKPLDVEAERPDK
jgi:exodeoxyribonuclease VII small subunit